MQFQLLFALTIPTPSLPPLLSTLPCPLCREPTSKTKLDHLPCLWSPLNPIQAVTTCHCFEVAVTGCWQRGEMRGGLPGFKQHLQSSPNSGDVAVKMAESLPLRCSQAGGRESSANKPGQHTVIRLQWLRCGRDVPKGGSSSSAWGRHCEGGWAAEASAPLRQGPLDAMLPEEPVLPMLTENKPRTKYYQSSTSDLTQMCISSFWLSMGHGVGVRGIRECPHSQPGFTT